MGEEVTPSRHFDRSERSGEISGVRDRAYYVCILSNAHRIVLYVGTTSDLIRRIYEHRQEFVDGFTKRYHCHDLLYYEQFATAYDAITREKQVKRWSQAKKLERIRTMNPNFYDLSTSIL